MADIAVIRLPKNINFKKSGSKIVSIFLDAESDRYNEGFKSKTDPDSRSHQSTNAIVSGFGLTSTNKVGFRKMRITTKSKNYCQNKAKSANIKPDMLNIPDVFCGQGLKRSQICNGDSGGPIFVKNPRNGELVQLGITVWADENCDDEFNGFMKVDGYVRWLEKVVEQDGDVLRTVQKGRGMRMKMFDVFRS